MNFEKSSGTKKFKSQTLPYSTLKQMSLFTRSKTDRDDFIVVRRPGVDIVVPKARGDGSEITQEFYQCFSGLGSGDDQEEQKENDAELQRENEKSRLFCCIGEGKSRSVPVNPLQKPEINRSQLRRIQSAYDESNARQVVRPYSDVLKDLKATQLQLKKVQMRKLYQQIDDRSPPSPSASESRRLTTREIPGVGPLQPTSPKDPTFHRMTGMVPPSEVPPCPRRSLPDRVRWI